MFVLTVAEWEGMWSQIATTSQSRRKKGYLPHAFTEFGGAMLASVLRSPKAIALNIAVVRAFIALRKAAILPAGAREDTLKRVEEISVRVDEHDNQLRAIYDTLENLLEEQTTKKSWEERERIGFNR